MLIWEHLSKSMSEAECLKCLLVICYVTTSSVCSSSWLVRRGWGGDTEGMLKLEACDLPLKGRCLLQWGPSGSASGWAAGWSVKFGKMCDVACRMFCDCPAWRSSCISSVSTASLPGWREHCNCSLASAGMCLCLPAVWPGASPCPGAALAEGCSSYGDVSGSFLLGQDVEAPAFSQHPSLAVPFTHPSAKLLGRPQPSAARGATFPLQPWGGEAALGAGLLPPSRACQGLGSQITCRSVLVKEGRCELTCLVSQAEKWEGRVPLSLDSCLCVLAALTVVFRSSAKTGYW